MPDLYIKLKLSFFTHRKTAKLRFAIGDDAFWIPPRLWAYAAEKQKDGDFSGYTSEELAMLLGCDKHASCMLQALKDSGFIDQDGRIHDWTEHNGYHETFSRRGKLAAMARHNPEAFAQIKKAEMQEASLKHATSMQDAMQLVSLRVGKDITKGISKEERASNATSMQDASGDPKPSRWDIGFGLELPNQFQTDECLEAIKDWLNYKKERKDSYKPTGLKSLVKKWSKEFTAEQLVEAIEHSMACGYKGTFPPNQKANGYQPRLIGTSTPDDAAF